MKILYLDLGMGAAGDMLTGALLDAMDEKEKYDAIKEISSIDIPGVCFDVSKSLKCGISGTYVNVKVSGKSEADELYTSKHEYGQHEHDFYENDQHGHGQHEHGFHENDQHGFHDHGQHEQGFQQHDFHEYEHSEHNHASLQMIDDIIEKLNITDQIKSDVKSVYKIIADAESHVHNKPVSDIHFHEVGTMDAIADIAAVCILIRKINADKIYASPVHVGSGQVKCAHGILPVPAPATAYILKNIPMYSSSIRGELCTPTGAALLKYFVDEFGSMPVMSSESIGYGMGYKDFERANCVRAIIGSKVDINSDVHNDIPSDNQSDILSAIKSDIHSDVQSGIQNDIQSNIQNGIQSQSDITPVTHKSDCSTNSSSCNSNLTDEVVELRCNIDDMTGEEIGFAFEQLMCAGALDVFTSSIYMKKNRPGVLLTVICSLNDKDKIVKEIFKNTTTIGIRESLCQRYILGRDEEVLNTALGQVRKKHVAGYGVSRSKEEYEDIAKIARDTKMSIMQVKNMTRS